MSEEKNVEDIISSESLGFSNILRKAREQKGMSLADVGAELHLHESVIYAIENNNLDKLPEPAYVCGYIRNYARFMGIDPVPLVNNFKETSKIEPKLNSVTSVSRKLERKEEKRSVFFLLFLVILLFLGGFFGWQLWQGKVSELFLSEKTEKSDSTTASLLLNQSELTHKTAEGEGEAVTNTLIIEESKANIAPNNELNNLQSSEKKNKVRVDGKAIPTNLELVKVDTGADVTIETHDIKQPLASTSSSSLEQKKIVKTKVAEKKSLKNKKELQFKFTKNSWISVKEGNTKSLIYDLVHKGEVITLYGKAPVNIFLGDGTGVELSVDGKSYDFASHINTKKIAKFVVK
jgi:cytoskeleton protein RodZ